MGANKSYSSGYCNILIFFKHITILLSLRKRTNNIIVGHCAVCHRRRRPRKHGMGYSRSATHYEPVSCVARGFKARVSLTFTGCCWWQSSAVDGGSGARLACRHAAVAHLTRGTVPILRPPRPLGDKS